MQKHLLVFLFCLPLIGPEIAMGQSPVDRRPADPLIQQLLRLSEEKAQSEKRGDLDGFLRIYDEGAICMPDYQTPLEGRKAIASYYQVIFRRQKARSLLYQPEEWIDLRGTIVEIGRFTNAYSLAGSGDSVITRTGKYWNIWEAAPDGGFRLKGEAYGYFRPVEDPGALTVDIAAGLSPSGITASTTEDKESPFELKAYSALTEKGVRNRDGLLRASFFTGDARLMPFADSTRTGMDQIRPYLVAYNSGSVTIDSIDVHTLYAEDHGAYLLEYTLFYVRRRTPGQEGSVTGKGIRIWVREPDHSLRIFREISLHNLDEGAERTRIRMERFRADYRRGLMTGDPGKLSSYFAEQVRIMPEFQKTLMGRDQAASYLRAFLARFTIQEYTRTPLETLDLVSRTTELGLFRMKITEKGRGSTFEMSGKYLDIWGPGSNDGREPAPSLLTEAWNYDQPLEIEDELRFPEIAHTDIAFQAHSPVNSPVSFELAALNRLLEMIISEHNAELWSRVYADDILYCYSRTPIVRGKEGMNRFLEEHVRHLPVFEKLDIRNDRIDDLGGFIIEYGSHTAIWRDGGSSGANTGKDIRIWRREKDGYLRIFRAIGMYD